MIPQNTDGKTYVFPVTTSDNILMKNESDGNTLQDTVDTLNDIIKNKLHYEIKTLSDGSVWRLVFYHKLNNNKNWFISPQEAMNCNGIDKFSILSDLDSFKRSDGKIEFLLEYPEQSTTQYNRWKQNNNPCREFVAVTSAGTGVAEGYTPIHIDWSTNYWGGLTRQNSDWTTITTCFLSGSVGHGNWYYCLGTYQDYNGGMPSSEALNSSIAHLVKLWARID